MPLYDSVQTILTKFHIDSTQAQQSSTRLLGTVTRLDKGLQTVIATYRTADGVMVTHNKTMYATKDAAAKAGKSVGALKNETAAINKVTSKGGLFGTGDSAKTILSKVASWTVATGAIFGTIGAIKKAIGTMAEFDSGMVGLKKVFQGTEGELRILKDDILNTSVSMGSLTSETMKAAIELGRMGKTRAEISELVRVSLLAQNIAEIDAASATKFLNAAILQFNKTADDAIDILDKWNILSNRTPVETRAMAQAVSIAGAVFKQAGGDLEDLNAYVSTLTATMAKNGREIGTALKTIASYAYRQQTMKKVMELTGIQIEMQHGQLMDLDTLLSKLSARWEELTEAQQEELAQSVAGVRRKGFFLNLMENFNMTIENQALQWDAAGSSMKENAVRLESLNTKVKQLQASLEKLSVNSGDSGILFILKGLTTTMRLFVDNLNEANLLLTIFAGAAVGGSIKGLLTLSAGFVSTRKAAGALTMSVRVLNSALFKWTAAITIGMIAFNGLMYAFNTSTRRMKGRLSDIQKETEEMKKQRASQTGIIDGYKALSTAYDEYIRMRDAGGETTILEDRLDIILSKLQELFPDLIKNTDEWTVALDAMGIAAEKAGTAIDNLSKQSIQLKIDTSEITKEQRELELARAKRILTGPQSRGGIRGGVEVSQKQKDFAAAEIRGLKALDELYLEWGRNVDQLSEKEQNKARTQRGFLLDVINIMREIEKLNKSAARSQDDIDNFDKRKEESAARQLKITEARKISIDEMIKVLKQEIKLMKAVGDEVGVSRLTAQLEEAFKVRSSERESASIQYEALAKLKEEYELGRAKRKGDEAMLALLRSKLAKLNEEVQTNEIILEKQELIYEIELLKLDVVNDRFKIYEKERDKILEGLSIEAKREASMERSLGILKAYAQITEEMLRTPYEVAIPTHRSRGYLSRVADMQDESSLIGATPSTMKGYYQKQIASGMFGRDQEIEMKINIKQIEIDEKQLKYDLIDNLSRNIGDAIEEAVYNSFDDSLTRFEKNRPWNTLVRAIGDDLATVVGNSVQTSLQKSLAAEDGMLSLGSSMMSAVGGNMAGAMVSMFVSGIAAAFLPTEDPQDTNTEAVDKNTQSIRALTDEMKKFTERYINAPSTFALGAITGETPQAAGGARLLTPGLVYGHAGELIGKPEQFQYSTVNNQYSSSINNKIEIHTQPGQNAKQIAEVVIKEIDKNYGRGGKYGSKM